MTTAVVTENTTSVTLTQVLENTTVTVTPTTNTVTVTTNAPIGVALMRYRVLGNSFTGVDAATSRAYTFPQTISNSATISLGKAFMDETEYSLSTVTLSNDTLTVLGPLWDSDVVTLWT